MAQRHEPAGRRQYRADERLRRNYQAIRFTVKDKPLNALPSRIMQVDKSPFARKVCRDRDGYIRRCPRILRARESRE